jgi:hypothetical protein
MKPVLGIEGKSEIAQRLTATLLAVLVAMVLWTAPAFAWAVGTCPLTQGFWKNHPDDWPSVVVNAGGLTLGTVTYTEAELITILKTPVGGDASLNLAHQLIAAMLNVANGSDSGPISATITDANGDIGSGGSGTIPEGIAPSSPLGADMVNDAAVLDAFNEGKLTPICMSAY